MSRNNNPQSYFQFLFATVIYIVVVIALIATIVIAADIILILMFAILFGVFLYHTSSSVQEKFGINYQLCLGGVTFSFLLLSLIGIGIFGIQVDSQVEKASEYLSKAEQKASSIFRKYPVVKSTVASTPFLNELVKQKNSGENGSDSNSDEEKAENKSGGGSSNQPAQSIEQSAIKDTVKQAMGAITSLFKTTFGLLVNSLLIFFVGLFIAVNPQGYRDGIVELFSLQKRERVRDILNELGETLWRWLLGRFGSMLITGVGAGLLLLVLGIPMAITLGIVTALLTFIPNIGGLISLILAVLFAIPQGTTVIILVFVGYIILQLIESYVVTPIIQKKQVSLPPALLIAFQAIMGVLFGLLGAAAASPVLAAGKRLVEMAYIEDVLEADTTDN